MSDRIRWGILSTAKIAETAFIPSLQHARRGELVAIASRDGARAQAFADEHGIPESFDSYDAMLASDRIDAVYIPLPNSMHAEWTAKAAAQGKHVFCEKPLGVSAAEAEQMVETCRDARVLLFEPRQDLRVPRAVGLLVAVLFAFLRVVGREACTPSEQHAVATEGCAAYGGEWPTRPRIRSASRPSSRCRLAMNDVGVICTLPVCFVWRTTNGIDRRA